LGNGSWENDVLSTATALRALARWLGLDRAGASTRVSIIDAALREAVNRSLGHHAMDTVIQGDLWRLTSLDLSYAATGADLSALAAAQNITTIDISGNPCLLWMPNRDATLRAWFPQLTTIIAHPVGDIDGDDAVTGYDEYLLVRQLLGRVPPSAAAERAADVNVDGRRDARDLYWLDRVLLNASVSQLCP
jgi:hypothetical protein